MTTRRQPAKKAEVKQEEPKPIEEEIKQIEVKQEPQPEQEECSIKVRPDLYKQLMKLGGHEFWSHVLENYYRDLSKRYRS